MQSLRAPEMANGKWELVFAQLFEIFWVMLLMKHKSGLKGNFAATCNNLIF